MSSDYESIPTSDIPFHPIIPVSLILSLANQLEKKPDTPLLKNMDPQQKLFFQKTLSHALENIDQHFGKTGDSL